LTPTGLVLWPVCGPVLSLRCTENCALAEVVWPRITATWPSVPLPRMWDGHSLRLMPVSRVNTAGIRGNVPSRFRRRPPALGTNRGGSAIGTVDGRTEDDRI